MSVNFYDKDNKELVRVAGGAMYATAHEAQITNAVNIGKVTYFRCGTMVNVYTNINIGGELAVGTVLATGLPEPLMSGSSSIRACASVLNTNLSYDLRITANGELVVGQSASLPAGDNYYVPACISYFAKGSNITSSASLETAVSAEANKLLDAQGSTNDCNTTLKAGVYSCAPQTANRPTGVDYGILMVFGQHTELASPSVQWIYQFFYETAGRIYRRQCINPNSLTPNIWTNWVQVPSFTFTGSAKVTSITNTLEAQTGKNMVASFPVTLPNTNYTVSLTLRSTDAYWADISLGVTNKSTSNVQYTVWNNGSNNITLDNTYVEWIVTG